MCSAGVGVLLYRQNIFVWMMTLLVVKIASPTFDVDDHAVSIGLLCYRRACSNLQRVSGQGGL